MGKAVVDAGGHETELVAYVIAGSFKSFREDALGLVESVDGIRSAGSLRLHQEPGSQESRRFLASTGSGR